MAGGGAPSHLAPPPACLVLGGRRTRGLRDDAVVTRVLAWTQDAATTREVVAHKSAVYEQLMQGLRQQQQQPAEAPEARPFLEVLRRCAAASSLTCLDL